MHLRHVVLAVVMVLGVVGVVSSPAEALVACVKPNGKVVVLDQCQPGQIKLDVNSLTVRHFIVNVFDDPVDGVGLRPGSTPGTLVERVVDGQYRVFFGFNVSECAGVANAVTLGGGTTMNVQMGPGNEVIIVATTFNKGIIHPINVGFSLIVVCN